jgi:hypothetical protein
MAWEKQRVVTADLNRTQVVWSSREGITGVEYMASVSLYAEGQVERVDLEAAAVLSNTDLEALARILGVLNTAALARAGYQEAT